MRVDGLNVILAGIPASHGHIDKNDSIENERCEGCEDTANPP